MDFILKFYILLITGFSLYMMGCQRPNGSSLNSKVILQAPRLKSLAESKVGTFGNIPTDRKACYAVSITGPDIIASADACSPTTGVIGGFVEEGATLELTAPRGKDRKIDLYVYLQAAGENNKCPDFTPKIPASLLRSIYRVGTVGSVALVNEVETISIPVDFQGVSHHIASELSLPASCLAGLIPARTPGFYTSMAQGVAIGGTYQLNARIGLTVPGVRASNSQFLLKGTIH